MNILKINPIEFAGAVAHVAAAQMHVILTDNDGNNWMVADLPGEEDLVEAVGSLAQYCVTKKPMKGQLLNYARISGLYLGGDEPDLDTQWAYDLFTSVAALAHAQLVDYQAAVAQAATYEAAEPQPLKLEDSIFEPHGSLGDMEPHQQQFLQDLMDTDNARHQLLMQQVNDIANQLGVPAHLLEPNPESAALPKLTIGQQETENAQGVAETGSSERQTAAPAGEGTEAVCSGSDEGPAQSGEDRLQPGDLPADGEAGEAPAVPSDDGSAQAIDASKPEKVKSAKAEN